MTIPTANDALVIAKHEARRLAAKGAKRMLRRPTPQPLPGRLTPGQIKRLIIREGFATGDDGGLTWFYTAVERGDADPLTNYSLGKIADVRPKDSRLLITGCGTGITAFYLADVGFTDVTGIDLLPECIHVAERIMKKGRYTGVRFAVGDGFKPSLSGEYDVITALHWVFSAWMGNYGNTPAATEQDGRERILSEFVGAYTPYIASGGCVMVELTDAVTDYRLPWDHPLGEDSKDIYPVRHSPGQVQAVAAAHGLKVTDQQLCVSYGHHPRTMYELTRP